MKKLLILLLVLALPLLIAAKPSHMKTPETQECSECHPNQMSVWLEGKHGLLNVKCVVCHGSTDGKFSAKPGIYQCRGCHAEKVADVERTLSGKSRDCFLCHTNHSLSLRFHSEGGAKP